MSTLWTCQRTNSGVKCGFRNPGRRRKCMSCGKPRPARRRAEHTRALELDYAGYIALNGGERCAICGREPSANRRLDRDHDHRTGRPRGLLCARCNRALPNWVTGPWLFRAALYVSQGVGR